MKKSINIATVFLGLVLTSTCWAGEGNSAAGDGAYSNRVNSYEPVISLAPLQSGPNFTVSGNAAEGYKYKWKKLRAQTEFSVSGDELEDISQLSFPGLAADRDVSSLSLMGNIYYDMEKFGNVIPYVFGGVGAVYLEADQLQLNDVTLSLGSRDEAETALGYQAGAGLSYFITDEASVDLDYKYFVTDDLDLSDLQEKYDSHNVTFGFRLKF